jgi:hypothetical protein
VAENAYGQRRWKAQSSQPQNERYFSLVAPETPVILPSGITNGSERRDPDRIKTRV